jgi:hypothetical protein
MESQIFYLEAIKSKGLNRIAKTVVFSLGIIFIYGVV